MNGRGIVPAVVLAVLFVAGPACAQQGQDPSQGSTNPLVNNYGSPYGHLPLGKGLEDPAGPDAPVPPVLGLSPWICGASSHPDGCCGPVGKDGPISWDIYLRNGIAVPFGGSFAGDLNIGYAIQGGARTLLFDPQQDAAWVIDFGITSIFQTCAGDQAFTLFNFPGKDANNNNITIPQVSLTGDRFNRTLVGLSLGRELWLIGSGRHETDGADTGLYWRAGWDVGGRWGTARYQPNEVRHLTATIGGVFVAAHTDLEIPFGGCIFQTGFRVEWGYTWSDILQSHNNADVMDILLMWNLGVRF
jgi:hypothetical protein